MLIPRKVNKIIEEMNDEVFKNMAVENANVIKHQIYRIIRFYQSQEADKDVYDVEVAIGDFDKLGFSEEIAKAIEDEKEISKAKENANKDVEALVKSTKHDKCIKFCSEIVDIRRKLGAVSISDLAKIVGKEVFSSSTTSLFAIPGDKHYIKVLKIINDISSIVNTLSTEVSLEEMVEHIEKQFDKLDEIAESLKDSSNCVEDKQLFSALEYLNSIKAHGNKIGITELLKAFVIGKIVDNESEYMLLMGTDTTDSVLMMRLGDLINAANFDIKDKSQVNTCKALLSTIKQRVLQNKAKFSSFTAGNPFPMPMPGLNPKNILNWQKADAFDKIVEALRPVFIELVNEKPTGFGFPCNGWGSPFNS